MMGNVRNAENDMRSIKISDGFKERNFEELDKLAINLPHNHITDFWVNPKNDESREISAYEIREVKFMTSLQLLVGVDL